MTKKQKWKLFISIGCPVIAFIIIAVLKMGYDKVSTHIKDVKVLKYKMSKVEKAFPKIFKK